MTTPLKLQKASNLSEGSSEIRSLLGYTYAVAGDRDEALKMLDVLNEQSKRSLVSPFFIARIYAGLREKDQAFEWLEEAYEKRAIDLFTLNVNPQFDNVRSDPRFADLVLRIGLTP
ncbi:MAG: hypothetical protein NVSMB56_14040 [Pyrinomonadaceae bacterium]